MTIEYRGISLESDDRRLDSLLTLPTIEDHSEFIPEIPLYMLGSRRADRAKRVRTRSGERIFESSEELECHGMIRNAYCNRRMTSSDEIRDMREFLEEESEWSRPKCPSENECLFRDIFRDP